ncbi:peptidylprolyl isomerase [Aureococcus anophagefferens]|nr:peptidylprolyl isomerase [Aureococcus anophagefferens]
MNGEDTHIGEVDNYAGAEDINSDGSVLKLTLKIGDEYGCPNLPKTGDEVAIHYTCKLAQNHEVVVTTKGKQRKKIRIGDPGVVTGMSEALKTMRTDEVSQFAVRPSKAYGDRGAPPKIPPNATLIFEIELKTICPCSDCSQGGDGSVVKLVGEQVNGVEMPSRRSDIAFELVSLRVIKVGPKDYERTVLRKLRRKNNIHWLAKHRDGMDGLPKGLRYGLEGMLKREVSRFVIKGKGYLQGISLFDDPVDEAAEALVEVEASTEEPVANIESIEEQNELRLRGADASTVADSDDCPDLEVDGVKVFDVEDSGADISGTPDNAMAKPPPEEEVEEAVDDAYGWDDLEPGCSVHVECKCRLIAFNEHRDCEIFNKRGLVFKQTQRMPVGIGQEKRPRNLLRVKVRGSLWVDGHPELVAVDSAPCTRNAARATWDNPKLCEYTFPDQDSVTQTFPFAAWILDDELEFELPLSKVVVPTCEGLEIALKDMLFGEVALINFPKEFGFPRGSKNIPEHAWDQPLEGRIELAAYEEMRPPGMLPGPERVAKTKEKRDRANYWFNKLDYARALRHYTSALDFAHYARQHEYDAMGYSDAPSGLTSFKDLALDEKLRQSARAIVLNRAACYLKLKRWNEARADCQTIIDEDVDNLKAQYRMGVAQFELGRYDECRDTVDHCLSLDGDNKPVLALRKRLDVFEDRAKKKGRKMFGKKGWDLFTPGPGEAPNPAPRRAPRPRLEEDEIPPPSRSQSRLLGLDAERDGTRLQLNHKSVTKKYNP